MLQFGKYLDFSVNPFLLLRFPVPVGLQALHGVDAVGDDVADLEDLAHAAVSQQPDDLVVTYGFADL